jgi:hypothetical protein
VLSLVLRENVGLQRVLVRALRRPLDESANRAGEGYGTPCIGLLIGLKRAVVRMKSSAVSTANLEHSQEMAV